MTELMDEAIEKVRHWSAERQEAAAELLLALDELGSEPIEVDAETLAAIDEALTEVSSGRRADLGEVESFFARYRK